jgi:hypothetical protein
MCPQPRPSEPVSVYARIVEKLLLRLSPSGRLRAPHFHHPWRSSEDTDIPTWEQAIEDYQQIDIPPGRRWLWPTPAPGVYAWRGAQIGMLLLASLERIDVQGL